MWGPSHSPDYQPLMGLIVAVVVMGFLSAIFPIVELILSIIVIIGLISTAVGLIWYYARERKLDHEAFYGHISERDELV